MNNPTEWSSEPSPSDALLALDEECAAFSATLDQIPSTAWGQPALGVWTVAELVAHVVGGLDRIRTYLEEPEPTGRLISPVQYFRYDPRTAAPGIAQRARERAAHIPTSEFPQTFARTWMSARARAAAEHPNRVMTTFGGPMRLEDYLETRVLEVVVHHLDLRSALALSPEPTARAERITLDLLEGLLGESRPPTLGRIDFIRVATGREAVDDPRLPVLA